MSVEASVLIVGGNLGAAGLLSRLNEAYPQVTVDVASVSQHHPLALKSDKYKTILYESGHLEKSVNLDSYDFFLPGSHDLYLKDLVYGLKRDDLIANFLMLNS